MPSRDDRAADRSGLVPMPGLGQAGLFSGPLPPNGWTPPVPEAPTAQSQAPVSGQLFPLAPSTGQLTNANITRVLTSTLPRVSDSAGVTSQRVPVVIKASMKKAVSAPLPVPPDPDAPKKHRLKLKVLGLLMLMLIIVMALFSVTPLGHEIGLDNPLTMGGNVITGQNPGPGNFVAQATATAVYHRKTDGYDPSFYGSQSIGSGSASLAWPLGQCTFWANYEYHRLTGNWISWNGNADQWVAGARQAGWNVSASPHVPSIMVMMPYTQYASGYGHVAVVEGVSGNTVHTSNMNWYANGGGWDRVSNVDFTVGRGIYFIWRS